MLPVIVLVAFAGCGKFDRSSIKMPKFSFVTTENLHSIALVDPQHLWVSGNYGTILFSADCGKTWTKQDSGIEDLLLGCIRFANRSQGWAAGVKGTIVHTGDGGKTWNVQQSGIEEDIHDLFFFDSRHGWAVGELGTVLHTGDGGRQWKRQMEQTDRFYNGVFFADRKTGWIVGEFGTILHTRDGGATWQPQQCADLNALVEGADWDRPLPALYGLFFRDRKHGWAVGMDGVIIRTVDGGENWKLQNAVSEKPLYSIVVHGEKGWIVGNKGVYLTSGDGGGTWSEKQDAVKTKFWLREVSFYESTQGLMIGARGTIARSEDGGASWELVSGYRYDMEEFGLADF